jgi:hypothetical protein
MIFLPELARGGGPRPQGVVEGRRIAALSISRTESPRLRRGPSTMLRMVPLPERSSGRI